MLVLVASQRTGRFFSAAYSSCVRAGAAYKEPGHAVDTSADVSPKDVKVPYLSDNTRVEMYKRHKADPQQWSISKLSQHYGATLDRTKAVLFLMQKREELMVKEKVADIPPMWHEIFQRFSTPATAPPVAAPATEAAPVTPADTDAAKTQAAAEESPASAGTEALSPAADSKESLAKEFGISVSEVGDIIARMQRHTHRQRNVEANTAYIEKIVQNFADVGVDTSFRETATAPKRASIKEDYYPTLFGDDGLETAKKELLDRIAAETKAEIVDFQSTLFAASATDSPVSDTDKQPGETVPPNKAGVKTDTLSRWKIAFRDLSWRRTQPTMIRTRRGNWRHANALEDALRSWRKHPSQLDMEIYRDEVRQFLDPDGDEQAAAAIRQTTLSVRRERKLAVAGGDAAAKK